MRFSTTQHQAYCGIDLHARTMDVCILNHDGEILGPQNFKASPETFLKVIAPYRDDLVVAVECLFTWYWLADLRMREGIAFVLGHALSMKAIHGGKAKNDRIDAQKIAVLLRGGILPQAYVYPAEMRATRALLRRRVPLMRQRAELLTHIQTTTSQYNLPEMGKKLADKANRDGVAERFSDPAVQKRIAVDLALLGHDDELLRDVDARYPAFPTGPGCCLLLPSGQGRQRIGGQALRHLGDEDRQRVSHMGLLRSGRALPPGQSCRTTIPRQAGEKARQGQGLDRLGPQASACGR